MANLPRYHTRLCFLPLLRLYVPVLGMLNSSEFGCMYMNDTELSKIVKPVLGQLILRFVHMYESRLYKKVYKVLVGKEIPDLSTQQQGTESILVKFESLLFVLCIGFDLFQWLLP